MESIPARLDELLMSPETRLIMLIGEAGSGKTTMIEQLASRFSQEASVGIVDADIGQSHIGLPGTVAWGKTEKGFPGWDAMPAQSFYFTGTVSPVGNLLPLVVGTSLMAGQALGACDKVFIDTTGLINGSAGRALKQMKIDMLRPDLVIALEREDELEPILASFRFQKSPTVVTLPVPDAARTTSRAERTRFRQTRFLSFFADARVIKVSLERTALRFSRDGAAQPLDKLAGRLVSLRDESNKDVAMGIIEGVQGGNEHRKGSDERGKASEERGKGSNVCGESSGRFLRIRTASDSTVQTPGLQKIATIIIGQIEVDLTQPGMST